MIMSHQVINNKDGDVSKKKINGAVKAVKQLRDRARSRRQSGCGTSR